MKATIDGIQVEGTPREINELLELREKKDEREKEYNPFDTGRYYRWSLQEPYRPPWVIPPQDSNKIYCGKGNGIAWFHENAQMPTSPNGRTTAL